MTAFWRDYELIDEEQRLLDSLYEAHFQSCFRENASSVAVAVTANASEDLPKAIVAAIMTMGGKHAPLEDTVRFLSLVSPADHAAVLLKRGEKIPGWGGTFQDGAIDPIWVQVEHLLKQFVPMMYFKLQSVTAVLKGHGKLLAPNPSAYTASVAISLGMPPKLAPYLFINGRLNGWAELAYRQFKVRKTG